MIYIIMHKKIQTPQIPGNARLLVGAINKPIDDFFDFRDDSGTNISNKNKNYCEMTGVYWIWKNSTEDIKGICHYRRFFSNAKISVSSQFFLTEEEAKHILEKKDIILPTCFHFSEEIKDSRDFKIIPTLKDMAETRKAIEVLYPDYLIDFDEFMNNNSYYPYNMFVAKANIFDEYCKWIYDILFWIEKDYGVPYQDDYRSRLFGFISERIFYIWVKHNIPQDRIKEMRVVNTEENVMRSFRHTVSNIYRELRWRKNHNNERKISIH